MKMVSTLILTFTLEMKKINVVINSSLLVYIENGGIGIQGKYQKYKVVLVKENTLWKKTKRCSPINDAESIMNTFKLIIE